MNKQKRDNPIMKKQGNITPLTVTTLLLNSFQMLSRYLNFDRKIYSFNFLNVISLNSFIESLGQSKIIRQIFISPLSPNPCHTYLGLNM